MDLSVILPYVNEYPQIAFTLQTIVNDLRTAAFKWEVITVNNYCDQVRSQGFDEDRGYEYLEKLARGPASGYLRNYRHDKKLSCWGSRSAGARASSGHTLLFLDSHVVPTPGTIQDQYYTFQSMRENGTLHLPLSYLNDRPGNELIYRLRYNKRIGMAHYVFHKDNQTKGTFALIELPCMSNCGMMIGRELFVDTLGCYPEALGIYGGGENYFNFTLSVLGYKKFLMAGSSPLYHYAESRGYRFDGLDWLRNRLIAIYLAGGEDWADRCVKGMSQENKAPSRQIRIIHEEVMLNDDLRSRRKEIKAESRYTLDEWLDQWDGHYLAEKVSYWK